MRLIVKKIDGSVYVYRETEKQFKRMGRDKAYFSDHSQLDNDCDFSSYPDGTTFVFKVKK